jgi:hypothetical protein
MGGGEVPHKQPLNSQCFGPLVVNKATGLPWEREAVTHKQPLYSQYSVQLLLNDLTTGLSNRRGLSLIKSHKKKLIGGPPVVNKQQVSNGRGAILSIHHLDSQYSVQQLVNDLATGFSNRRGLSLVNSL